MSWEYAGEVIRVVDGDTVDLRVTKTTKVTVDFGFYVMAEAVTTHSAAIRFRLFGIDTPEVVGAEKAAGLAAEAELVRLLGLGSIRVVSYKSDSFGRWLADLYVTPPDEVEIHVNQALVDGGFAVLSKG